MKSIKILQPKEKPFACPFVAESNLDYGTPNSSMSPESYYQREHLVLERLVSTEGQTCVNQSFALLIFCNQAGLISERERAVSGSLK